jgi:sugar lactone lactonase YvrE
MRFFVLSFIAITTIVLIPGCKSSPETPVVSQLFLELPDFCPTPDGMAIDPAGNLILACPNFADTSMPAVFLSINGDREWEILCYCPVLEETGFAYPMGIEIAPDGTMFVCDNQGWPGTPEGQNKGRILALHFQDGELSSHDVIAFGMSHPNGIKYKDGYVYVTQSMLPAFDTPQLTSGVYRFPVDGQNIMVNNDSSDPNLIITFNTKNPDVQYGLDGLVFNSQGDLFVGDFGDATLYRIKFDDMGNVTSNEYFASSESMTSIDGIGIDKSDNIYVADFSGNRICKVTPEGEVSVLAENPDTDGADGGLDQPGEPVVFNGVLVVTNFDLKTDPDKVNTAHDKPYTLSSIEL